MKNKRFYIETLGCKVNQYESDGIAAELEEKGLIRQNSRDGADICIVNTCAVTSKAGMQSRQTIRRLIRENPGAKILVTGCHAQTDPDQIQKIPEVDHIVCHKEKGKISQCLTGGCKDKVPFSFAAPDFDSRDASFLTFNQPVSGNMSRAYLKIQDGCNAFCTYCIVPYARGASVSMPKIRVINHLNGLAKKGFKEVIIAGIHTGMYGLDLTPATSLLDLVRELDDLRPVDRLRISSIEPNEISKELIDLAGPGRILCDHFHIPLQSGDNEVLKRMKRPYTAEQFIRVIEKIHCTLPHAGIGLDIIIGFPGETDAQFENTYALVERLPVSYLHVFPFSARKGTPAFHFKPKVPSAVIKERAARLRELGLKKQADFIRANKERPLQALVQHQTDDDSGMLKAVTANYLTVMIPDAPGLKGNLVELNYTHWDDNLTIAGKVLHT
ncbi:MAG TPA: tRNA (N(6)-L-threonylcarbamoyladenosine(37)-C(2))-methylthiotransferase MtaB [Desulfobacteraceae bacterium]|nr:tRNA (N(6)-L-threonylcarbamoyladenosine(37)-C(2))-methylthiotransferase MtaB [Desulfobacteraceae bacterium]